MIQVVSFGSQKMIGKFKGSIVISASEHVRAEEHTQRGGAPRQSDERFSTRSTVLACSMMDEGRLLVSQVPDAALQTLCSGAAPEAPM